MYQKCPHRYVEGFFYTFLPRLDVKDEHIVRMMSMKLSTPDSQTKFTNHLDEGIELLIRTKEVRALA